MSTIPKFNPAQKLPQTPTAAPAQKISSLKMQVPDSLSSSQETLGTKTPRSFFQSLQDCFSKLWKCLVDTFCFCFKKKESSTELAASQTESEKNASETKMSKTQTEEKRPAQASAAANEETAAVSAGMDLLRRRDSEISIYFNRLEKNIEKFIKTHREKRTDLITKRIQEFFDAVNEGPADAPIIKEFRDHINRFKDQLLPAQEGKDAIPPQTIDPSNMLADCICFALEMQEDSQIYAFASLYAQKKFAIPKAAREAFISIRDAQKQMKLVSEMPGGVKGARDELILQFFAQLLLDEVGTGRSMEACKDFLDRHHEAIPTIKLTS